MGRNCARALEHFQQPLIKKEVNLFIVIVNCICTFYTTIHCNSTQPSITVTIPLTFPDGWSASCMRTNKKINFQLKNIQ